MLVIRPECIQWPDHRQFHWRLNGWTYQICITAGRRPDHRSSPTNTNPEEAVILFFGLLDNVRFVCMVTEVMRHAWLLVELFDCFWDALHSVIGYATCCGLDNSLGSK